MVESYESYLDPIVPEDPPPRPSSRASNADEDEEGSRKQTARDRLVAELNERRRLANSLPNAKPMKRVDPNGALMPIGITYNSTAVHRVRDACSEPYTIRVGQQKAFATDLASAKALLTEMLHEAGRYTEEEMAAMTPEQRRIKTMNSQRWHDKQKGEKEKKNACLGEREVKARLETTKRNKQRAWEKKAKERVEGAEAYERCFEARKRKHEAAVSAGKPAPLMWNHDGTRIQAINRDGTLRTLRALRVADAES